MSDPVTVKILPDEPAQIIGRQLLGLGCAIGTAAILIWVQKKMMQPDFFLTAKMRTLHTIAEYADSRSTFWRDVAAKASEMYLESRP